MNFDFGEVLSHAWRITWKHKVLWIIGILFGFLVSLLFPLMFAPILFPLLAQNSRMDLALGWLVGFLVVIFLFILVLYPASVLTQTSLTLGVLDAEQGDRQFLVRELIRRSRPFFWRVLGLMILFALGLTLINFVIQAILVILTIATAGLGIACLAPLMFIVYYPALYGAMIWMEQSMNSIILDGMAIMEAARHGWNLIRKNLAPVALMALIVYFGAGVITSIALVPLMIPFLILPLSFMNHEVNWTVLAILIVCVLVFISLFAIVTGASMIFTKSAWVLTYQRLTRSPVKETI